MARKLDNYLKTHRKRSGLHQHEVAYLLGTKDGTRVGRYELSIREPTVRTVFALEVIFNVPAKELFAGIYGKVETQTRKRAAKLFERVGARHQDKAVAHKLASLRVICNKSHKES